MHESSTDPLLDALETRIKQLHGEVRTTVANGAREQAAGLHEELRRARRAWDALVSPPELEGQQLAQAGSAASVAWTATSAPAVSMLPVREQVHRVLMLLQVPAAASLITEVHGAIFPDALPSRRLSSLHRDEERAYMTAPGSRAYYLCPALTADRFSPARGLFAVSAWPLERRIIGPLSTRASFLTCAVAVAAAVKTPPGAAGAPASPAAQWLLARFALNIPGAILPGSSNNVPAPDPDLVAAAAQAELDLHADADHDVRHSAAQRAREQLDNYQQLFGIRPATPGDPAEADDAHPSSTA